MAVESTPFGDGAGKDVLGQIRKGMTVLDATGDDAGTVDNVQMADPEAATIEPSENDLVFDSRTVFTAGNDAKVTDRMRQTGYFKLNSKGLFGSATYITPEMIDSVTEGTVRLKYEKGDIPEPA